MLACVTKIVKFVTRCHSCGRMNCGDCGTSSTGCNDCATMFSVKISKIAYGMNGALIVAKTAFVETTAS